MCVCVCVCVCVICSRRPPASFNEMLGRFIIIFIFFNLQCLDAFCSSDSST